FPRKRESSTEKTGSPLTRGRAVVGLLVVALLAGGACWVASLGPAPRGEALQFSTIVLDRNDQLLRPYTMADGRWRLPASRESVDPRFLNLLFAYEDKRFPSHHGVDPVALARAFVQMLRHGHAVSGASTLTMQVARLLEPRPERSLRA